MSIGSYDGRLSPQPCHGTFGAGAIICSGRSPLAWRVQARDLVSWNFKENRKIWMWSNVLKDLRVTLQAVNVCDFASRNFKKSGQYSSKPAPSGKLTWFSTTSRTWSRSWMPRRLSCIRAVQHRSTGWWRMRMMISRQSRNLASNTYCTMYKLCPAQEAKKAQQRLEASLRQEAVLEPAAIYTHYKQSTHVAACSGGTSGLVPRLCLGRRRGCHALEARWEQVHKQSPKCLVLHTIPDSESCETQYCSIAYSCCHRIQAHFEAALAMEQIFLGRPHKLKLEETGIGTMLDLETRRLLPPRLLTRVLW